MFLPNAVATLQGDLLTPLISSGINLSCCIFLPDKDVRNKEIMGKVKRIIDLGYRVCMLPESFTHKDVNEAVCAGVCPEELSGIIFRNTFSGLEASLRFTEWSRIKC